MVSLTFGAPLPALLNFEAEHQKMQALATENHHLHNQLASTRQALAEAESSVQKLDARLVQQVALQTATKRSGGKSGKPAGKHLPPGMPKKTSSFSSGSPIKKPTKTTSLEEKVEGAEKLDHGASSPQKVQHAILVWYDLCLCMSYCGSSASAVLFRSLGINQ